jgi:MFS family permease
LLGVIGSGTIATGAFLAAVGITTGVLIALTFPIGVLGAEEGGFNVAVVGALLTLVWAVSGLVGPSVGGLVTQTAGDEPWFLLLSLFGFASAAWVWLRCDRAPLPGAVPVVTDPERP